MATPSRASGAGEAPPPEALLHLELLGGLRVTRGGIPLGGFASQKARALLAYLAITGRPHARAALAGLLWGELPEADARTNLRGVLMNLQRVVGPHLQVTRETIAFDRGRPYWLDVEAFEAGLQRRGAAPDPAALEATVALYRGAFLDGLAVREAPAFEEWLLGQRERLRQLAVAALHALAAGHTERREYLAAIDALGRLLALDPWREEAHRQLMTLLALSGQRSAALAQYAACRRTLADELGVEPAAETRALYERIRAGQLAAAEPAPPHPAAPAAPAPATPPAARAPDPGPAIVGRRAERARLQGLWRVAAAGAPRLAVLAGEAGIGKTRLAEDLLAWAAGRGSATATGRCYAAEGALAFAPVTAWLRSATLGAALPRLPAGWLGDVARLLPELLVERPDLPRPAPLTQPGERERLFEALERAVLGAAAGPGAGPPLVLLLDDLQWCDRDTLEWLHYLLRADPPARLLVVGTLRLEERGDNPPLATLLAALGRAGQVAELEVGPLDAAETAALARQAAGRPLDPATLARLHGDTEGNPLFVVELARAADPRGAPAAPPTGAVSPTVQAVIAARLARLSPPAREVAGLAATIGRAFPYATLARAHGADEGALVAALEELAERRILREQGAAGYDFGHDKLREVAYAGLGAARRRLVHRRVAEALEAVHGADLDAVSGQVAAHYDRAGQPERAIPAYQRAAEAARRVGADEEAIAHLACALTLLRSLPDTTARAAQELALQLARGPALSATRGYADPEAERAYARARDLGRQLGDDPGLFRALQGLAILHTDRGELLPTHDLAAECLGVARRADDPALLLAAHTLAGTNLLWLGALAPAHDHLEAALARADGAGRQPLTVLTPQDPLVTCLCLTGAALTLRGYPDRGRARVAEALARARGLAHPLSEAFALLWATILQHLCREAPDAQARAEALLALAREQGFTFWTRRGEALWGWARAVQGEAVGLAPLRDAVAAQRRAGVGFQLPFGLALLAEVDGRGGRAGDALRALDEALATVATTGERWGEAELHRLRGALLAGMAARQAEAEAPFGRALAVAREQGAAWWELRAALGLARLWQRQGKLAEACALLAPLYDRFTEGFDTSDLLEVRALLDTAPPPETARHRIEAATE